MQTRAFHAASNILAAFTCASIIGCAATGVKVTDRQISALKVGETTEAQAVELLGRPTMRTRMADGTVLVIYSYVEVSTRASSFIPIVGPLVGGSDMRSNTVTMKFDRDGKLMETTSSESNYGTGTGAAAGDVAGKDAAQPRQSPSK